MKLLSDSVTPRRKERVTLSRQPMQRIRVIENAVAGKITVREAAQSLNRSERQVQRLKGCCDVKDAEWVKYGNRGTSQRTRSRDTGAYS